MPAASRILCLCGIHRCWVEQGNFQEIHVIGAGFCHRVFATLWSQLIVHMLVWTPILHHSDPSCLPVACERDLRPQTTRPQNWRAAQSVATFLLTPPATTSCRCLASIGLGAGCASIQRNVGNSAVSRKNTTAICHNLVVPELLNLLVGEQAAFKQHSTVTALADTGNRIIGASCRSAFLHKALVQNNIASILVIHDKGRWQEAVLPDVNAASRHTSTGCRICPFNSPINETNVMSGLLRRQDYLPYGQGCGPIQAPQ